MDLVGKVYGIPCHQLIGGKCRGKVRLYGDTPAPKSPTPQGYVDAIMRSRALGLTFVKFDLPARLFEATPGALVGTPTKHEYWQYKQWFAPGREPGACEHRSRLTIQPAHRPTRRSHAQRIRSQPI